MYKNDYGRFTLANTGIIQRAIYQKKYPKTSGVKDTMAAWDHSQYVSLLEFKQLFFSSNLKTNHCIPVHQCCSYN